MVTPNKAIIENSVNSPYRKQKSKHGGITEIVLPQRNEEAHISTQPNEESLQLILPMLAYLSSHNKHRWITWINQGRPSKDLLNTYGIDSSALRFVYPPNVNDILWITWEALNSGNSHTVIASPGILSKKYFQQLDDAAAQTHTRGLMLRFR